MKNMHSNRRFIAFVLGHLANPADKKRVFAERRYPDTSLDHGYRGAGNAALRRQGIETGTFSCECDICVVYGGECGRQYYQEWRSEYHRERRGVKTRGQ